MPTKKVNAVVREGTAESRGPDSMLALCSSSQPSLGSVAETMLIYHRGEPNASHRLQASYSSQSSCNLLWINGPRSAREQNGVEGYPLKHKKLKHRGYRLETYLCILWSPSSLNTPADSGKWRIPWCSHIPQTCRCLNLSHTHSHLGNLFSIPRLILVHPSNSKAIF